MATHVKTAARASLFDRLIDLDPATPEERQPLRVLDLAALKESVRGELERVLNTRCARPAQALEAQGRSILDYGVPDMSALCPQNADELQRLTRLIAQAVNAFEPRLRQVRVGVEPDVQPRALRLRIDAVLATEDVAEPVSFPVLLMSKSGEASVHVSD